jgi:hypothetical protein
MQVEVVRMSITAKSSFVRCENGFDIPESLCTQCLHTIVARDFDALERAEDLHDCSEPHYRARTRVI